MRTELAATSATQPNQRPTRHFRLLFHSEMGRLAVDVRIGDGLCTAGQLIWGWNVPFPCTLELPYEKSLRRNVHHVDKIENFPVNISKQFFNLLS